MNNNFPKRPYTFICVFLMVFVFFEGTALALDRNNNLGYTENKGQIIDQNNNPNLAVKYLFHSNGLNIQLRRNGFSYDTYTIKTKPSSILHNENLPKGLDDKFKLQDEECVYHFNRIDIEFIGANENPELISEQPSIDYTNYYTTGTQERGVTFVRTFQKVTYKNLYDGIDLEFGLSPDPSPKERGVTSRDRSSSPSGRLGGVKYNFIIHPGADASQIKWKYYGTFNTGLYDGKIILATEQGNLEEKLPESFVGETLRKVNVNYSSHDNNVFGFSIPDYDKNSTLIIDPVPWATYFGGNGGEIGFGISTDTSGNILITGYTGSTSNIATSGAYQTTIGGVSDIFVSKFTSSGSRMWSTYYGGSANDYAYSVATDISGNSFISGFSQSSGLATIGAYKTTVSAGDVIVSKFNVSGILQWGTYYGGTSFEYGVGIALDHSGNVLVTGYTSSATGIATTGAFLTTATGSIPTFIVKFNPTGTTRIFGTYYSGNCEEKSYSICSDSYDNIYVTGYTCSTSGIATAGAYHTAPTQTYNNYVSKFNSTGTTLLWGTYYGGGSSQSYGAIVSDSSGNVYVTGDAYDTTGVATAGAFKTNRSGTRDAFLAKFNTNGNLLWGTYYGGEYGDISCALKIDQNGDILISGYTISTTGMTTPGAYQTIFGGGTGTDPFDAFVAKFNTLGTRVWGTYYGGANQDQSYGITNDKLGNVVIVGGTISNSAIATVGSYQSTYGGGGDAFIASFTSNGGLPVQLIYFDAEMKDNDVQLIWQTAYESDNDYFEIQRAVQPSQCPENYWEVVGKVKGNGTTNAVSEYQFTNEINALTISDISTIYYRLKQVDIDGNYEYSDIVAINFDDVKTDLHSISINPNPVSDCLQINSSTELKGADITITDMIGKIVYSARNCEGFGKQILSTTNLDRGIYFLIIQNKNKSVTTKFIKQ